eukprot:c12792_g1_i1.p1 GENE.c12792_g1_i1~~c12792_g1_i1.p1  ORF type:complete len:929 (+),score=231.90 c12792_g1_i1:36-2822(+)
MLTPVLFVLLVSCSKAKRTASESLQDFSVDYGNGKLIVNPPTAALTQFIKSVAANGAVPSSPHYYAGTNGRNGASVDDAISRHAMLLPPHPDDTHLQNVASAEQVVDSLMLRTKFIPENRAGVNMMLVTFANWFLDEFFRTEPNTNGTHYRRRTDEAESCSEPTISRTMRISQLYGTDPAREASLRTFSGGKLRTGDDNSLPPITDVANLSIVCGFNPRDKSCLHNSSFYAVGHERFNIHPGHLLLSTVFLRAHNDLCDTLHAENPTWDDQKLFDTARLVLTHILTKTVVEDYVTGTISATRDVARIPYDPNVLRTLPFTRMRPHIFMEFNHLYRWHALIADNLLLDDAGETMVPLTDLLFAPRRFAELGPAAIGEAMYRTRVGSIEAFNVPYYLREITIRSIRDERAQRMRGFNDYRQYYGLKRLETFEEFNVSPEATAALANLYPHPDNVDLFVGLMVEQRYDTAQSFLSESMLRMVTSFAFSAVLNFETITNPSLFSEATLSASGLAFARDKRFKDLLETYGGMSGMTCGSPFLLPGVAVCEEVTKPTGWSWQNILDFVGQDEVADPFFDEGYFTDIFEVLLWVLIVTFFAFYTTHHVMLTQSWYKELDVYEKFRLTFGATNVLVLVCTGPAYTYLVLDLLLGPDFIGSFTSHYKYLFAFFLLHGALYIVEICSRLVFFPSSWLLMVHHLMWFAMILAALLGRSIFLMKVDFILDLHVNFEAGLFMALLVRRVSQSPVTRLRWIRYGVALFFVTRITQALMLGVLLLNGKQLKYAGSSEHAMFVIGVVGSVFLVLIQTYTLFIYWLLYRADRRRIAPTKPHIEVSMHEVASPRELGDGGGSFGMVMQWVNNVERDVGENELEMFSPFDRLRSPSPRVVNPVKNTNRDSAQFRRGSCPVAFLAEEDIERAKEAVLKKSFGKSYSNL